MNYFWFIFISALADFKRNKGRTFLTSLGILIGVLSVVLLTAFGLGLKKYIEQQFEDLGANLVRVVPGRIIEDGNFRGGNPGGGAPIAFTERDFQKLNRIKNVNYVAPIYTTSLSASYGNEKDFSSVYSGPAEMFTSLNVKAEYGELFSNEDVNKRSKVVVLGPTIAEKLFKIPSLAIGKDIRVNNVKFTVIGITNTKGGGGFGGPDFDAFIYMPYKTAYIFNTAKTFQVLIVQADSEKVLPAVKRDIERVMLQEYTEDEFSVLEQTEILNAINSIFGVVNTVLVAIAAISLLVGGIGIMNIMYVSVSERTKEIGIRRAIGARRSDILYQFLVESVILSVTGGIMAIGLAFIIVWFTQRFFPAYIDLNSVLLALGVSSGIGIVFGVFPAKKAADLSPIDAIRYE